MLELFLLNFSCQTCQHPCTTCRYESLSISKQQSLETLHACIEKATSENWNR